MSKVISVSKSNKHEFSKDVISTIPLTENEGVEGDAHRGKTVKHRSRVKKDPSKPNLRQVHLIHNELLEKLREKGFRVSPGTLGENITTEGIDLLSLPRNTVLSIGDQVEIEITGLRNPGSQLDHYQEGLTAAVLERDDEGNIKRKAGVMAIITKGGVVKVYDIIQVKLPVNPHHPLERV